MLLKLSRRSNASCCFEKAGFWRTALRRKSSRRKICLRSLASRYDSSNTTDTFICTKRRIARAAGWDFCGGACARSSATSHARRWQPEAERLDRLDGDSEGKCASHSKAAEKALEPTRLAGHRRFLWREGRPRPE